MVKKNILIPVLALALASHVLAAEVQLTALSLQAGKSVEINFARTMRAPSQGSMRAVLLYDKGQTSLKLNFAKMEPAILFAGDISAYVLWAVTIDGTAENLGEVAVDSKNDSGSQQYYTAKKDFALIVTAEPFSSAMKPTAVILFSSGTLLAKNVRSTQFTFKNFSDEAKPALDSISGIQYNDNTPVAMKQARKTLEFADKINAAEINPKAMERAKSAFAQAESQTRNKKLMADSARIAAQLAAQAIKDTISDREARAAAEAEAKRLAEKAVLEQRAFSAEAESERIARELKEVDEQRRALAEEKADLVRLTEKLATERDELAAEREEIKKERDELAGMLKGALSSVAETTETARGVIVSLSGILFDLGKATLKPASQITVAKLAGILMVFPNMDLSIEGYTDSTGSAELNMRLSTDRARGVYEFLLGQGISADRMKYQGFGPENPVAPNDVEANRAKNRRVEVVLTQAVKSPK